MKKRIWLQIIFLQIFFVNTVKATENINIHGFISQGYIKTTENNYFADTKNGSFEFNEMGISFATNVTERLHLGMQFFARDFGNYNNDEVIINWAYGDYKLKDGFGIRAGKMKITLGLYNEYRDMDQLRTNILYPSGVYNESWRDMLSSINGCGLYGNVRLNLLGKLRYFLQAGSSNYSKDFSGMNILEEQIPIYLNQFFPGIEGNIKNSSSKGFYAGSIFLNSPFKLKGLKMGVSYYDNTISNDILLNQLPDTYSIKVKGNSFTASIEYVHNNYTFASEYNLTELDIKLDAFSSFVPKFTSLTYYASLSYSFTEMTEAYIAYSEYYRDKNNMSGNNSPEGQDFRAWLKEIIFCVRFDLNPYWIVKLETHINNGATILMNNDQESEPVDYYGVPQYPYKKNWLLFIGKVTYSF